MGTATTTAKVGTTISVTIDERSTFNRKGVIITPKDDEAIFVSTQPKHPRELYAIAQYTDCRMQTPIGFFLQSDRSMAVLYPGYMPDGNLNILEWELGKRSELALATRNNAITIHGSMVHLTAEVDQRSHDLFARFVTTNAKKLDREDIMVSQLFESCETAQPTGFIVWPSMDAPPRGMEALNTPRSNGPYRARVSVIYSDTLDRQELEQVGEILKRNLREALSEMNGTYTRDPVSNYVQETS